MGDVQFLLDHRKESAGGRSIANGLLRQLPDDCLRDLRLERVRLRKGEVLEEPRLPLAYAYFIESGLVCIQTRTREDGLLGSGVIGRSGMTGVPIILETMRTPLRAVVQAPGEAYRVAAEDLHRGLRTSAPLRHVLLGYVQALLVQSAYIGLCNARHSVERRVRRWLLLAHFAVNGDDIRVTHQLIAKLLGVRRPSVTVRLAELEREGAVRQQRGCVTVVDGALLATGACECHRIVTGEFRKVLGGSAGHSKTKRPQASIGSISFNQAGMHPVPVRALSRTEGAGPTPSDTGDKRAD
jgi:CRP-like cAMP-binding protein